MSGLMFSDPRDPTGRVRRPVQGQDVVNVAAALNLHLSPAEGSALCRLLPALVTVVNHTDRGNVYVLNHEGRAYSAVVVMPGHEATVITAPDTEYLLALTRQLLTQALLGTQRHTPESPDVTRGHHRCISPCSL